MSDNETPLWEEGTLPDGRRARKLAREATEEERRAFLAVIDLSPLTEADRHATAALFPELAHKIVQDTEAAKP